MRGHLGGGSDQPDQVAVVVVGLPAKYGMCKAMKIPNNVGLKEMKCLLGSNPLSLLQLLVQLEELALVLVAVALGAALVAHREPAARTPKGVVNLMGTSR